MAGRSATTNVKPHAGAMRAPFMLLVGISVTAGLDRTELTDLPKLLILSVDINPELLRISI